MVGSAREWAENETKLEVGWSEWLRQVILEAALKPSLCETSEVYH